LHPESNESTVINITSNSISEKSNIYATLMLWKKSGEKWTKNELVPIKILDKTERVITIQYNNGTKKVIDFN
jgi:hypothetical protein